MAAAVFVLCTLTSLVCALLLLRGFARSGARLLLWSGCCFVGLAISNGLLFVDVILLPNIDLFWIRTAPEVIGLALLVFGLVWEAE